MLRIPKPADPDVPVGGEDANQVVRTWGEPLPRGIRSPIRILSPPWPEARRPRWPAS
jgi:seryl-tRNA synthetase